MAAVFEIYQTESGKYRFRLRASNGEVVATGQSYGTAADARRGVRAVQRAVAEAGNDGLVSMQH